MPIIRTRVNGTRYGNCRWVIADFQIGEDLILLREPDNEADANAILVLSSEGEKAGYVPRELAATLAPLLDAGDGSWPAKVAVLTGGFEETAYELWISFVEPMLEAAPA